MNVLLKKGAEASLYLSDWYGKCVVIKQRLPKAYRPPQLDQTIRRYRTVHEPQLMHEAKRAGVPTPAIFMVDVDNAIIVMEYIEGHQVKLLLDGFNKEDRAELCCKIGGEIAKLHIHGIVHGDLTTSNLILSREGTLFFVDFGLGIRPKRWNLRASTYICSNERCKVHTLSMLTNVLWPYSRATPRLWAKQSLRLFVKKSEK